MSADAILRAWRPGGEWGVRQTFAIDADSRTTRDPGKRRAAAAAELDVSMAMVRWREVHRGR